MRASRPCASSTMIGQRASWRRLLLTIICRVSAYFWYNNGVSLLEYHSCSCLFSNHLARLAKGGSSGPPRALDWETERKMNRPTERQIELLQKNGCLIPDTFKEASIMLNALQGTNFTKDLDRKLKAVRRRCNHGVYSPEVLKTLKRRVGL